MSTNSPTRTMQKLACRSAVERRTVSCGSENMPSDHLARRFSVSSYICSEETSSNRMSDEGRYLQSQIGTKPMLASRCAAVRRTDRYRGVVELCQSRRACELGGVCSKAQSGSPENGVSAIGTVSGENPEPMTTLTTGTRIPSWPSDEPGQGRSMSYSIGTRLNIQALPRGILVHMVESLLVRLCEQCGKGV